jgi:Protein of unknown function (DUF992)
VLKYSLMIFSAAMLSAIAVPAVAQQSNQAKAGVLACRTSASLGLIVGSHQKLRCRFTPDAGGPPETYVGHINRLGLDLGIRAGGAMVWAVLAPTNGIHHGALAGTYVGASGSVSVGLGANANVLVGGSHRSIALQPLSVEGQVGVNLALGVAGLSLRAAP